MRFRNIVEIITEAADRDFTSDTGYWTKASGVTIPGDGTCVFTDVAGLQGISRLAAIEAGKTYLATFEIISRTAGGVRPSIGGMTGTTQSTPGTYSEILTAGTANFSFISAGTTSLVLGSVSLIEVSFYDGTHLDLGIRLQLR